jgi:hypothetical protein
MKIHSVLLAAAIGGTLVTVTPSLSAQGTDSLAPRSDRWELLLPSGTVLPTGAQRDAVKRGNLSAVQVSFIPRRAVAITSTFGWARSRDVAAAGNPKLDVFTYDVGAEVRGRRGMMGSAVSFMPFAGAGAGGRSYNYRSLDVDATHNAAAYATAGAEIGVRRVRVRLEARDYLTGFKPLAGGGVSRTGNDVMLMAGLRLVSR